MKNLVVCCDGTWNEPDEQRDGAACPTNVAKLALALTSDYERGEEEGPTQLVHYERGVGTSPGERLLGGAFGYGISRNIRDCYRFLARYYEPGDKVFLFGFSRGAYTARSLGGLIHNCGILRSECIDQVDAAYAFYRDRSAKTHPKTIAAELFREEYSHADSSVHFVGVWDTVGSLGIPAKFPGWKQLSKVFTGWQRAWGFHDTRLGPDVKYAYHALAIDEQRPMCEPTLWTLNTDAPPGSQEVEQVWFAGVHSEVGGGTADSALSDIAFLWMADKAAKAEHGLLFRDAWKQGEAKIKVGAVAPNYAGTLRQSRRGFWGLFRRLNRLTSTKIKDAPDQMVAASAERRYEEHIAGYRPPGLDYYLEHFETEPTEEMG